ncbi:MAG: hypothetical protein WBB25_07995 [Sulfitobacter sp.]
MKRLTNRRTVLFAGSVAAVAAATGTSAAQSTEIRGAVKFQGGELIPEGHIKIYLEDVTAVGDAKKSNVETHVESNGKSKSITFSFPVPESYVAKPTLEVVAYLERADGWLLARGSTQFEAGSPVNVTLNAAMY